TLISRLERQKFGATDRPRAPQPRNGRAARYIPRHVKRAVWERDGGQCTFVGTDGHRCAERRCLEFDHIEPVARGGKATFEGIRLRCRAHNQYAAECSFGADFMDRKRKAARAAAVERRNAAAAEAAKALAKERAKEVIPWLEALGIRAKDARRAAERCESIPDASIEERVKV